MTSGNPAIADETCLADRLECGEILFFPVCPFILPEGEDLDFLHRQQLRIESETSVALDPTGGRLRGQRFTTTADAERLAHLLRSFSSAATGCLANLLPEYAGKWTRDRATLRTEEEATRQRRHDDRNDLLHVDSFPDRPAAGRRILRFYANINPVEERVWNTSEKFDALLERYRRHHRIPERTIDEWRQPYRGLQRLLHGDWSGRPAYDSFILKLQQFIRFDEEFQERAPRRFWHFPPNSAWLLFADGLSHAVLRGQFALEHSYFVPPTALVMPELSPLEQLANAADVVRLRRAG
jgi:hypothetical protein